MSGTIMGDGCVRESAYVAVGFASHLFGLEAQSGWAPPSAYRTTSVRELNGAWKQWHNSLRVRPAYVRNGGGRWFKSTPVRLPRSCGIVMGRNGIQFGSCPFPTYRITIPP